MSHSNREALHRGLFPCAFVATLVTGGLMVAIPSRLLGRIEDLVLYAARNARRAVLVCLLMSFGLGAVSANFRIIYLDEKSCFAASKPMADGGVADLFGSYGKTKWLGKHHPPLTPMIYGVAMAVFGSNLFVMRMVPLLFSVLTMFVTYRLGQELYDRETGLFAAAALMSYSGFTNFAVTANNDMCVTFFFCLSALLAIRMLRTQDVSLAFAAGMSLGFGLLTKYTLALIYPLVIGCSLIYGSLRQTKYLLGTAILISAAVLGTWLWYASHLEVIPAQSEQIGNIARYGMGLGWYDKLRYLYELASFVGFYNAPVVFLGGVQILRRRSKSDLVILLWIAAVAIPLILTFPRARYFLPCFPALAVLMAQWQHGCKAAPSILPASLGILYGLMMMFFFQIDWSLSTLL